MSRAVAPGVLNFERFCLDLTRGSLRIGEQDIALRPKAFDVLCYLAQNAGRLVSKQELYEAVWPNVIVSDDSIAQCIRELRSRLGDDDHSLIKTVPRRGYMLAATVVAPTPQELPEAVATTPPEAPPIRLEAPRGLSTIPVHKLGVWAALALLLFAAGWSAASLLDWHATKLAAQPTLEKAQIGGKFDGIWRVEFSNNDFCVEKSRIGLWSIRQGVVKGGKSVGTISGTGEVRVTWPDLIDPTLSCVGSAKLQGDRGEGKWNSPRACGGALTLTQVSGP
jgi:DNA-binding winged helix-turn-helix (wHTH) protein